ncbi:flagellar M-ring protein FliF [bacterium]|nr:flagellar M-ring protein FliF [bacterium]
MAETGMSGNLDLSGGEPPNIDRTNVDFKAQVQLLLSKLSLWQKASLGGVAMAIIVGIIWLISWSGQPEYALLFGDLMPEDAAAIAAQLKEKKVPYRVSADGTRLEVEKGSVRDLRLSFVGQGLPSGGRGKGFELFDEMKFGTTDFVENINYMRALEAELAGTIIRFGQIAQARVHLVIPKRSLYWEASKEPTASVWVKLKRTNGLGNEQVRAIVHLVSGAVEGLAPKNISIVDSQGEILTSNEEDSSTIGLTQAQLKARGDAEKGFEDKITSLLLPIVGQGSVKARVSVSMDFNEVSQQEETYDPASRVLRSEESLQEETTKPDSEGGVPGTQSNINTTANQSTQSAKNESFKRNQQTRNYEVGKTIRTVVGHPGEITRISAAVILDDKLVANEEGEETTYEHQALSAAEIAKCSEIVKKAIGFSEDRGDTVVVENLSFDRSLAEEEKLASAHFKTDALWSKILNAARAPLIIVSLMLVFVFVIRPLIKGVLIREEAAGMAPAAAMALAGGEASGVALAGPSEGDMAALEGKTVEEIEAEILGETEPTQHVSKREILIKRINRIVESDAEGAVQLLRTWLSEGRRPANG